MSVRELSEYVSVSKYARHIQEENRRESWGEAVGRNEQMMVDKYPHLEKRVRNSYKFMRDKKVLGSMRALQFGGIPAFKHNARVYNCCASYCDRLRFFQECFYLLLCGCGTGFSVQTHHVDQLPSFSESRLKGRRRPRKTFVIEDCIEGWSDAAGALLSSYHEDTVEGLEEWADCEIEFDPRKVRKEGSPLSCGIGRAPGPGPLIRALEAGRSVLNRSLAEGNAKLSTVQCYDFTMHLADAAVAGGVRRSATICIFSPWDLAMAMCKTGSWFSDNPQRARSNNSAALLRDGTTWEDFFKLFQYTRQFGEPGFYWTDSYELIPNPCFHRDTILSTASGLKKIGDLFRQQTSEQVSVDNRAGAGDILDLTNLGVSLQDATEVHLTQVQADIYELVTDHGHSLKVTSNHEFPTTRGRLKLRDMLPGDTILLQSAEGGFGSFGTYHQGLILGMITGDGCVSGEEAFVDFWEEDFPDKFAIGEMVNTELSAVKSRGKKPCGNLAWQVQHGGEKSRMGGSSLYRWLTNVVGISDPPSLKSRVPECVLSGSREFVIGYLQGLYHSDGSVQMKERGKKSSFSIRLNQSNKELLADVQSLLSNFGIVSRLYLRREAGDRIMPDGRGGSKLYSCKANFDLVVNRPNAVNFMNTVSLFGRKKSLVDSYMEIRGDSFRKPEKFITRVKSISYWGKDDVFCLTVPSTNTVLANGLCVGQCVEVGFWPQLRTSRKSPLVNGYRGPIRTEDSFLGHVTLSGWEFCNLSTLNGCTIKTRDDFYERCEIAAEIGTYQAGFTDFPYLGRISEEIVRKESLLGVAICGMMHNPSILLNPEVQREGARRVLATNESLSPLCYINPCARGTCIKPDGKSSAVLMSEPGISVAHSMLGFRILQVNVNEAPYQYFKKINPQACEQSVWDKSGNSDCIRFCVEQKPGTVCKSEVSVVEMLDNVKLTYLNWIQAGKRPEACTHPSLSNNVSNTVNVKPDEWDIAAEKIYADRHFLAGVSLASDSCDRDFYQAPYTAVYTKDQQEQMYGSSAVQDSHLLIENVQRAGFRDLWDACDFALGLWGEKEASASVVQEDWRIILETFAMAFFDGDLKRATYCLKDSYNWALYCKLKPSYKEVDYTKMVEEVSGVDLQGEMACSGGACVIHI